MADFDEYEYLEKTVEAPAAEENKEKEQRSSRRHDRDGESGDRDRERERSSRSDRRDKDRDHRRSRSREKDREKKGESDKDKDRARDRERDGEQRSSSHSRRHERDEDRERRSSSRSRRHEKDDDRERDRERRSSSRSKRHDRDDDREKDRERRSSSHSRRHEVEREMERSRSKDRALRERERERELERELREREGRRYKDKKEVVELEADPERDQRTVFAYQMPLKATERDVYEFFSQVGKVRDVRLIMDRNSRRSKGVGYVEFYDVMSVPNAIALSGHLLLGQPVMVKPSEAEKNLVQSTTAGAAGAAGVAALRKLYVGNLHFSITEDQLRQIFEPFGPVELVQLPLDLETGHCRGYGFVQFAQLEHAKAAQSLNGKLDIAGRIIKVSAVTDHVPGQDSGAATELDDEDGALSINAQSRAILMQKLDRTGTASSIAESLAVPALNGSLTNPLGLGLPVNLQASLPTLVPSALPTMVTEPVGKPSECLLLKNMFDPKTETEPDFDLDIKEDVQEECSKFGRLRHIYVDKNSDGCVYLCYETVAAATSCQQAMHGRWFAGRSISTIFMSQEEYEGQIQRGDLC
ncbi:RNA-binding protein 39 [Dioscorea alata]|uniref:RNA-binding protein 39 n=1 Tax=Dioscorea alata TaxID=55571 RepID=A0ACB7WCL6_DIOAL|nr:RNA-binding protein 39 [Dioscorea alata]